MRTITLTLRKDQYNADSPTRKDIDELINAVHRASVENTKTGDISKLMEVKGLLRSMRNMLPPD